MQEHPSGQATLSFLSLSDRNATMYMGGEGKPGQVPPFQYPTLFKAFSAGVWLKPLSLSH